MKFGKIIAGLTVKWQSMQILISILAILFDFICSGLIIWLSGHSPLEGILALWVGIFGSPQAFGEALRMATPLIFAGLSVSFAYKTGLFNIGVEGQLLVGWLVSVWIGYAVQLPSIFHIPFAIFTAWLAGMAWGAVPGFLKAFYGVNEVIVTIMMNYIALYVTGDFIRRFLFADGEKSHAIRPSASLHFSWLTEWTNGSRFHIGFFLAIFCCVLVWFLMQKTTFGYTLRASGYNRYAALYAGMSVKRNIILSMAIAGGLAGVGGAMEGLGTFGFMPIQSAFSGIGFNGIAVALLGGGEPIGIFLSACLFGSLQSAAPTMNFQTGIPSELITVMIALIIFFVAAGPMIYTKILKKYKGGRFFR